MTGHPGVFAGGDMVPGERTVTVSIGHGEKAARAIDAWLRAKPLAPVTKHRLASYDKLNTWYYSDAPATVRPRLDTARRVSTFDEVIGGLDETIRMRQLLRRMPRQRRHQTRPREPLHHQLRLLQRLRNLRNGMPLRRHRDGTRKPVNDRHLTPRAVPAVRPPRSVCGGRAVWLVQRAA